MTSFTSHKQILDRVLLALCCAWLLPAVLRAQNTPVRAWVSSVERDAQLSRAGRGPFAVKRGERLEADDVITTGAGARVVIALSDGSQVVVFANSSVTLKEFRTPYSMRELLDVTLGRVRVKIRHLGKQPNPYRVNSPAASIAVRGTGFLVDVQPGGETRVAVSEGLVEVASRADPGEKRLVAAGQQVIVAMRGRIGMALPGPGSELNGRAKIVSNPVQDLAAAYQRSVEAVAQNSIETQPVAFAAFADAHLDSLENPAYAADFRQAQGRLLLLPSIRRTDRLAITSGAVAPDPGFPINGRPHQFDYAFTPQFTFFAPVPNSRFTFGGGITAVRTSLHALTLYEAPEEKLAQLAGVVKIDGGAADLAAINGSFIVARRFGRDGRTSLGLGIEQLTGDGSFLNVQRSFGAIGLAGGNIESETHLARTRATAGLSHEFAGGARLGVFYRYGVTSVDQRNLLRSPGKNELLPFDDTDVSTKASEIGARWRAPLTRRFFYGLEASYLRELIKSRRTYATNLVINERDRARRMRLAGGMGVVLRRNTFFTIDLSGGHYSTTNPAATGLEPALRFRNERGEFYSAHAAFQGDLGRRAFASASFLLTTRTNRFKIDNIFTVAPVLKPSLAPPYRQSFTGRFSTAGIGWKFKPNLIAEYLFSMDHSRLAPSHSLLFRYTFD
ncbi:MAG: FecR family protein, partial [Blastocatellia bacterium]